MYLVNLISLAIRQSTIRRLTVADNERKNDDPVGTLAAKTAAPFHVWILNQLEMGVTTRAMALFRDMLVEVTIPDKHDELIAAFENCVQETGFMDARHCVAKLRVEKEFMAEHARQKAAQAAAKQ